MPVCAGEPDLPAFYRDAAKGGRSKIAQLRGERRLKQRAAGELAVVIPENGMGCFIGLPDRQGRIQDEHGLAARTEQLVVLGLRAAAGGFDSLNLRLSGLDLSAASEVGFLQQRTGSASLESEQRGCRREHYAQRSE